MRGRLARRNRLTPPWPTLPPRLVAAVLAGHSAVALALGALIYLVCATGTLSVFIDELQLWEAPRPAPAAFDPAGTDRLVAEALALAGSPAHAPSLYLRAPITPRERTVVSVGARQWTPDAQGRLTPLPPPWTDFLTNLHITLTLPGVWGEMLVGLLGVGLFSLLVSGVLAHPRILRDAFVLRLGGGRRLQEADLHNRMGVWGLPFHLVVTLTGALFGLGQLLLLATSALGGPGHGPAPARVLEGPVVAADPRPAPVPPVGRAVAQSLALRPGSHLFYLSLVRPGTRGAEVTVEATAPGRLPRGEETYFDAEGRLIGRTRFASGELGLQLYAGAAQAHFGFFGGLPVRLVYGALGLSLCWVCAGGVSLWLQRRRDQGRPAPRLQQAWSAWVWGAPTALALSALIPSAPAPAVFWGSLAVLVLGSQAAPVQALSAAGGDRLYRGLLGATLPVLAAARAAPALHSGTAMAVEAVLLAAALVGLPWPGFGRGPFGRRQAGT